MLGNKTKVLFDRWEFSSNFFNAELERVTEEKDNTTFGALATSAEPGLIANKAMLRGYITSTLANSAYKEMENRIGGADMSVAVVIDLDDGSGVAEVYPDAWGKGLKVGLPAKDLITFDWNTPDAGNALGGLMIWSGLISATGPQTPIDFGVGGAAGGMAYLFVQQVSGTPGTNMTVDVRSGPDAIFTTSKTEGTFSFVQRGAYSIVMSGNVGRWVRINTTSLGGATSYRAVAIACVNGVTY